MTKSQSNNFQILLNEARIAGLQAVQKAQVVPMVVSQHVNPMDDNSPIGRAWFVADGVCGFAWVKVITKMKSSAKDYNRTLNVQFANWMKKQAKSNGRNYDEILLPEDNAYNGGVDVWVGGFNQSMQRKEAYAHAFADSLRAAGIVCYAQSRMD